MGFNGDFIEGVSRLNNLLSGLAEGFARNSKISFADALVVFLAYEQKFATRIQLNDGNQKSLRKLSNEIDEELFSSPRALAGKRAETFKIQEGAAEGKSICKLSS